MERVEVRRRRPLVGLVLAAVGMFAMAGCADYGPETPRWIDVPPPQVVSMYYPERANRLGQSGVATVRCAANPDGTLHDCKVVSEAPSGFDFGTSALMVAKRYRADPSDIARMGERAKSIPITMRFFLANQ